MALKVDGQQSCELRGADVVVRLTTDAALSYIDREAPFVLTRPLHLVIGPDEPFPADLATTCRSFAARTQDYWTEWVRRLSIAYEWQDAVIRAAITLKLSNFEETGGIIAAHTTSIPEAPGSGRNWDYRYCWLRDAYFVVKALNRLGATQTMEDFISFILGIAPEKFVRPVYSVVPADSMDEKIAKGLKGYRNNATGSLRQCGGGPGAARHLRQHHPRRDADVLRPQAAAAGRCRTVQSPGNARCRGGAARLRARRGYLGIPRPKPGAHAFGGDVLGRVQSSRRHRDASRPGGACRALDQYSKPDRRRD